MTADDDRAMTVYCILSCIAGGAFGVWMHSAGAAIFMLLVIFAVCGFAHDFIYR